MSTCRTCKRTITWAGTEHGKRIPLEPANGHEVQQFVLRGWHAIAVGPALFDTEPKYVYHRCPHGPNRQPSSYDPAIAEIPF